MTAPTGLFNAVHYIHHLLMLEHWWSMNQKILTMIFTTYAVLEMVVDVSLFTHVAL